MVRRHRAVASFVLAVLCASPLMHGIARGAGNGEEEGLELALKLEDAFTGVAERASSAVVVITNKQTHGSVANLDNIPPEFRFFFGLPDPRNRPDADRETNGRLIPMGKGSGVVLRPDGYIVTNFHVIEDHAALEVKLRDGRVFDSSKDPESVTVVGIDRETDLAVLRIGGGKVTDLPVIEFADSDKIRVGQWAIAVGAPFNLDYSVTVGHVSQIGRYDVGMTAYENYIQTDASINPGNSGGPLLDVRGRMIGINEFIVTGGAGRGSVGLGFAISSNLVKAVTDDLIEHGEVLRPFLGIAMQPLDDGLKQRFGVDAGVLVSDVMKGDPAEKAGVRVGDIVVKVGDKTVRSPHDLLFAVLSYEPGDKIRLTIDRSGDKVELDVVARRRGTEDGVARDVPRPEGDLMSRLGITMEEREGSVVIVAVDDKGPAVDQDVRVGDRVLEVNRVEVQDLAGVRKALDNTRNNVVVLYIDRRGSKFFVGIPVRETKE